jgi:hypothetical protein
MTVTGGNGGGFCRGRDVAALEVGDVVTSADDDVGGGGVVDGVPSSSASLPPAGPVPSPGR